MLDLNDEEYLDEVKKALAEDAGIAVANYFRKQILDEFNFNNVDWEELTIKKFLENLLIFNQEQE
jgi:hypothetical protein